MKPARRPRATAPAVGSCIAVAALLAFFAPAAAQEPATAAGLGYPVPPLDARAAALGGTGVGLLGGTFSLRNPAELTEHPAAGISLSMAPEALDLEALDGSVSTGRNRLSVVRAVVPLGRWAAGVGFGAEMDQDWTLRIQDTLVLSENRFPFEEVREHDGGISAIDLSLARQVGPLSFGVSGQRLTGALRQTFSRRFEADPDEEDGSPLRAVSSERTLSYEAYRVKGGVSFRVPGRLLLGGSVSHTSDLRVHPEDPDEARRYMDMPVAAEVGGSARLGEFLVTAAGGWTGWSKVGEVRPGTAAYDVVWAGTGVEFTGWQVRGVDVPLRLGARAGELPFAPAGGEPPVERALTAGFGAVVRGGLAQLEAALEVGQRGDLPESGLDESFRRFTMTFSIRQ